MRNTMIFAALPAAAVALLLAAQPAMSADHEHEWFDQATVAQFLSRCQSDQTWCDSTLADVWGMEVLSGGETCGPPDFSYDDFQRNIVPAADKATILNYLRARPGWSGHAAFDAVLNADVTLWPCPAQ